MVTLQVFPEGKGPEDGVPIAKFPLTVKNGSVSAKWLYRANQSEIPPDSDPKFVFSAHSAWCNFEKSSNSVAVKLVRPEIKKVEWQDGDGGATSKGLVGQPLKLHAETKDMEGGVTFHVFDEHKREVYSVGADINGDAADAEWTYHWNGIKLDHKPKFTVEVTGDRCKAKESGDVEISQEYEIVLVDNIGKAIENRDCIIVTVSGDENKYTTDSEGKVSVKDLIPGCHEIIIMDEDNDE